MTELAVTAKAKATVETVTMDDGRIVDFAGNRQMSKESFKSPNGNVVVRIDFRNGETRTCTLPESLLFKAAAHGLEQKLGDEAAGLKSLDDAILAIEELVDRLHKGEWNARREGGNGMAGTSVLLRAIVEVSGQPVETVKTFLSGLNPKQKLALRADPAIAPVVKRLEADKVVKPSGVDTGSLLDALKNGTPLPNVTGGPVNDAPTTSQEDTSTVAAGDAGNGQPSGDTVSAPVEG